MRIPSQAKFIDAFGAEPGALAYQYANGLLDCRTHPAVVKWAEQCYHDPRESKSAYPECLMLALNSVLEGCGVEVIRGRHIDNYHGDIQAAYINFGDTYDTTILLDHELNRLWITTWGDWVEVHQSDRELT